MVSISRAATAVTVDGPLRFSMDMQRAVADILAEVGMANRDVKDYMAALN